MIIKYRQIKCPGNNERVQFIVPFGFRDFLITLLKYLWLVFWKEIK